PTQGGQVVWAGCGALSPGGRGGHVSGGVSGGGPPQERRSGGVRRRLRPLPLSRAAGGGRRGARLAPTDDVARGGLSATVAPACPRAADAGRAVVWAVPSQPRGGPGRLSCRAWPAAAGGASSAGLADGVGATGGRPSGAVSHLWPAARVYGCHPTGRGSSPHSLGGVRRMRCAPRGSPTRGVVCLGTARGRLPQPGGSTAGRSRRQVRPSLPHVRGRPGLSPTG